jgi:hypothetical protein
MANTLTLLLRGDDADEGARDFETLWASLQAPWKQLGNKKGLLEMSHLFAYSALPEMSSLITTGPFFVENHILPICSNVTSMPFTW